jgi:putative MFS transporter
MGESISPERLAGPRIDALPKLTNYQEKILVVLILGYWFEFYSIGTIGYLVPSLMTIWHMDSVMAGIVLAASGWGMIVGSLTGGIISDFFGRRVNFMWALAVFSIFTFLGGFAQNPMDMIITRAIGGWGMGAETDSITTFIQELYPARMRGRVTSIAFGLGVSISGLGDMAIWILLGIPYGWQWVMWWGGATAIIVYILQIFWLPESPRWLQTHGRWEQAENVLSRIEKEVPEGKMPKYREDVKALAARVIATPVKKEQFHIRDLLGPEYRSRTAVCWSMTFFAYMGDRAYMRWITPLLLIAFGSTIGALAGGSLSIAMMIGSVVISGLVTDRIGRKSCMIISSITMTVIALVLGQIFEYTQLFWYIIVFSILIRIAAGLFYPNQYSYVTEQYPTRARALSFATSSAWSRITDSTGSIIFGWVIAVWGVSWMWNISALFLLTSGLIIWIWGISTKGKTLEELSK